MEKKGITRQFFRFAIVGLSGTLIHMIILYSLTESLGIYYMFSSIFAFIIAASSNFIFNKIWTFDDKIKEGTFKKYIKFFIVSIMTLLINLFILYTLTEFFGVYYIASQLIAIAISLWINFFGNRLWTFRK